MIVWCYREKIGKFNLEKTFTDQAAEDICTGIHEFHPLTLVRIREVAALGYRDDLVSMPLFEVLLALPELEDKIEVVVQAGGVLSKDGSS